MARWENAEQWDGKGNYLGLGSVKPAPILAGDAHICRFPHICGAFRCPRCGRVQAWCRGASDGPECVSCWDESRLGAAPHPLQIPLLGAVMLVFVIVLIWPP